MIINHNNPSDRRSYPESWDRIKCGRLFREITDRSETGNEELLSVSHITGITPRSQKNVTMFQAESLIGYKVCHKGDIVANTMWTWQGAIGVSDYDGVVSRHIMYTVKESLFTMADTWIFCYAKKHLWMYIIRCQRESGSPG